MKILTCGDSWTYGYGIQPLCSWPNYLNCKIKNIAVCGDSNFEIVKQCLSHNTANFDLVIIGWSGVTRFPRKYHGYQNINTVLNEFSSVDSETIKFFKDKSLKDLISNWENEIDTVLAHSTVPVMQFSVFGDKTIKNYENFIGVSCLEYLANCQGNYFEYDIPIFEFDWLNKKNYRLTKKFGKKYFNKNWQKACIEREDIRPGKYFLPCGHPNVEGHKLWGQFIKSHINNTL